MSNKRKVGRTFSDDQIATLRNGTRCPDCRSRVRISRAGRVKIAHDHGCPSLSALTRAGRRTQLAMVAAPDQPAEQFAANVAAVVREIAGRPDAVWSAGVRVSGSPYSGLSYVPPRETA